MRFLLLSFFLFLGNVQAADSLTIAAGAGYKKPMLKLYQAFTSETGVEVTPIFGNMRAVTSQVKNSGRVSLAVGDKGFLHRSGLFERFIPLGRGKLVLAWAGTPPAEGYQALAGDSIQRVAQPDPKKAIYGRAASQFLEHSGQGGKLGDRLVVTATVPQVSSYLVAKSVDAGFINLTDALTLTDKIGGYTELPSDSYEPIHIVAGLVKGQGETPAVKTFLAFLDTPAAKRILEEAGL